MIYCIYFIDTIIFSDSENDYGKKNISASKVFDKINIETDNCIDFYSLINLLGFGKDYSWKIINNEFDGKETVDNFTIEITYFKNQQFTAKKSISFKKEINNAYKKDILKNVSIVDILRVMRGKVNEIKKSINEFNFINMLISFKDNLIESRTSGKIEQRLIDQINNMLYMFDGMEKLNQFGDKIYFGKKLIKFG